MQQLALGGGSFEVGLVPVEAGTAYGMEQIEFRIAGLSGSEARSLAKVASGGELSRISLAIQVVTSQAASVPTLIFDEVDVGIGGGIGRGGWSLVARVGRRAAGSMCYTPPAGGCLCQLAVASHQKQ